MFLTVFGMLLGDTVILDTLDDANKYRQEVGLTVIMSFSIPLAGIGFPKQISLKQSYHLLYENCSFGVDYPVNPICIKCELYHMEKYSV